MTASFQFIGCHIHTWGTITEEKMYSNHITLDLVHLSVSAGFDKACYIDTHLVPQAWKFISRDLMTARQLKLQLWARSTHSENLISQTALWDDQNEHVVRGDAYTSNICMSQPRWTTLVIFTIKIYLCLCPDLCIPFNHARNSLNSWSLKSHKHHYYPSNAEIIEKSKKK